MELLWDCSSQYAKLSSCTASWYFVALYNLSTVFGLKTSAFYSYLIFLTCGLLFKWLQTSGIDISPDIGMKVNFIQFMPNTINLRNWQDFHISLTIPLHCCVDIDSFVRCAKGKILSKMARPSWLLLCLFWIGGGGNILVFSKCHFPILFWVSECMFVCVCLSVCVNGWECVVTFPLVRSLVRNLTPSTSN